MNALEFVHTKRERESFFFLDAFRNSSFCEVRFFETFLNRDGCTFRKREELYLNRAKKNTSLLSSIYFNFFFLFKILHDCYILCL